MCFNPCSTTFCESSNIPTYTSGFAPFFCLSQQHQSAVQWRWESMDSEINPLHALQMKGHCESKINVWFPSMYSQKWKYAASLFPKQNYNVLSPSSFTHISVRDLYIPMIGLPILLQPNMWILGIYKSLNTHECGNLDWGCAITRKGIHKWDFCCSVVRVS
jgi:hypothetical protein